MFATVMQYCFVSRQQGIDLHSVWTVHADHINPASGSPITAHAAACCCLLLSLPGGMAESDPDYISQVDPQEVDSSDDEEALQDQPQRGRQKRGKKPQQQKPRKKPQQQRAPCPGGRQDVGSEGDLRSLGKYGVLLLQKCKNCGGGPHQASMQVTDAELKTFLASTLQLEGTELEQRIKKFLGKL